MKSHPAFSRQVARTRFSIFLLGLLIASVAAPWGHAAEKQYDTTPLKPFPWEPTYPRDFTKEKLTAADWVGPDGIIYPDWSWVGVHIGEPGKRVRGIPKIENIFTTLPASLAGEKNGKAFTEALVKAIDECGEAGGGVIQIPAGTYVLTRPVLVRHNKIVIRGAGRGESAEEGGRDDPQETRIQFNFAYGVEGAPPVEVLTFPYHERITTDSQINFYAQAFSPKSSFRAREGGGKTSHIHGFYVTITPEGKQPVKLAMTQNYEERKDGYDRFVHFRPAGPTNATSYPGEKLADALKDVERATFQVRVVWRWKEEEGKERVAKEDSAESGVFSFSTKGFAEKLPNGQANMDGGATTAAITFIGDDRSIGGGRAALASDAKRGDTVLHLGLADLEAAEKNHLRPGQSLTIWTYESRSWKEAIERDGGIGTHRDQRATVLAVRPAEQGGVLLEIEQPLQLDFPKNEGEVDTFDQEKRAYTPTGTQSSFVRAMIPIEECGVEDLVLEQVPHIWFNGIRMGNAMNCWVKNVRVERAGRDPIAVGGMMNEIRSCEITDARYANNTGGGSAYLHGGSFSLIEDVYTRNLRHAPNFTGGTGGVVRNSRFFSSDMQWHQNWGRGHLFENCTVDALTGTGSYGYAAFAQRSISDIHGPGMGPRNVIYNCDLIGPGGGIFLGGKSENPLILFNRVRAWTGAGLILRYHVFNGIFLGNVFAVQNRFEPAVLFGENKEDSSRLHRTKERPKPLIHPGLGTANEGNDFLFNTLYGGNGVLAQGSWMFNHVRSKWRRSYGNKVLPWNPNPPRPEPAMASVFQTQRDHPKGFAHLKPGEVLFHPDPAHVGAADQESRPEGTLAVQVNFQDKRGQGADDPWHWRNEKPGAGWLSDLGEEFGERTSEEGRVFRYGWVDGKPNMQQQAGWADPDFRYRTIAHWGDANANVNALAKNRPELMNPFGEWGQMSDHMANANLSWQIELEPGTYNIFLAAGTPRTPERAREEEPLPFIQINDFTLNQTVLKDPGQSDPRRDAFWTTVTVGEDRRLVLKPAPTAITPAVGFIQIYKANP